MPCYDSRDNGCYENPETHRRLNKVTKLLCKVCGQLENSREGKNILADTELTNWWQKHQEIDRQHEAEERRIREQRQKKKTALAKLSKEERRILGIDR